MLGNCFAGEKENLKRKGVIEPLFRPPPLVVFDRASLLGKRPYDEWMKQNKNYLIQAARERGLSHAQSNSKEIFTNSNSILDYDES